MKDILTVMKFTINDMVKRKSFIISTVIILILIVVGFNIPNILKSIKGEDVKEKILIVDTEEIFEGKLDELSNTDWQYETQIGKYTYEEIKQKIQDKEISAGLIMEKKDNNIKVRYIIESATMMDYVPEDIMNTISSLYTNIQIGKLGLTRRRVTIDNT